LGTALIFGCSVFALITRFGLDSAPTADASGLANHISHFSDHFPGIERFAEKPAAGR
jgi:hypothetical protein